jgi:hypothetical protein
MSHKNKESLRYQVTKTLTAKEAFGESKHAAKLSNSSTAPLEKIYSRSTRQCYQKHCCYFVDWCKERYHCKTLAECQQHAAEWLQSRIDAGLSPYTIKLEASAVAKLYGISTADLGINTPSRHRTDITRSRGGVKSDRHFSTERNAALVAFCRSTGLRRRELTMLRGSDLAWDGERSCWTLKLTTGTKGGRPRTVPIIGTPEQIQAVVNRCNAAGSGLVWERGTIPQRTDIHSYRSDYATAYYKQVARPVDQLSGRELYHCRGDQYGLVFDRDAMLEVSRALGHNRVSVIASHYLRELA